MENNQHKKVSILLVKAREVFMSRTAMATVLGISNLKLVYAAVEDISSASSIPIYRLAELPSAQ